MDGNLPMPLILEMVHCTNRTTPPQEISYRQHPSSNLNQNNQDILNILPYDTYEPSLPGPTSYTQQLTAATNTPPGNTLTHPKTLDNYTGILILGHPVP